MPAVTGLRSAKVAYAADRRDEIAKYVPPEIGDKNLKSRFMIWLGLAGPITEPRRRL